MRTQLTTLHQQRIAESLSREFGIAKEDVYFPNEKDPSEPSLRTRALVAIARKTPGIIAVDETFKTYIEPLNQIVHVASVTFADGRTFSRSGIATIGEKIPGDDEPADAHDLAANRALQRALTDAGSNPLKAGRRSAIDPPSTPDEAAQRKADLAQIHILAEEAWLIRFDPVTKRKNYKDYRDWLEEHCIQLGLGGGIRTASGLNQEQRASVIAALKQLSSMSWFEGMV